MRCIFKDLRIKKELKRFKKFKENFNFTPMIIEEKKGALFCDGVCIRENEDAEFVGETEKFVNVGFKIHGAMPKILSNLFPYEFYFRGYKFGSIEGFFQGIKFRDKKKQIEVFKMSGLPSNNIKAAQDYSWKDDLTIYFLGKPYKRLDKEYEDLVDELYVSAIQNPLYASALKNVNEKYILHAMGEPNPKETVFSRGEFEKELNCLKEYCRIYK